MSGLLSPGVNFQETAPSTGSVQAAASAVPAFVGVSERGPIGEPILLTGFAEYRRIFGGFISGTHKHLPLAVKAFFDEGGGACYVCRVTHYSDVTDPATSTAVKSSVVLVNGGNPSPAVLEGADYPLYFSTSTTLLVSVDGGGNDSAAFTGTAERQVSSGVFPLNLNDNQTLTIQVDARPLQTITFVEGALVVDIDAITAAEAAGVINSQLVGARAWVLGGNVVIESDTKGTSSVLSVTGGTAAATFVFAETVAGAGNVATLAAVTAVEAKAIIEAGINDGDGVVVDATADHLVITSVATGDDATLQPDASILTAFGFDAGEVTGADDGELDAARVEERYASGLSWTATVKAATSGDAGLFDLVMKDANGVVIETWRNLSNDPEAEGYAPNVLIAGGSIFTYVDLEADGAPRPDNGVYTLAGGNTGLSGIVDADFIGGSGAGRTGLRALDAVLDLTLLAVPGRTSAAIWNGVSTYCETTREGFVFGILDIPANQTAAQAITHADSTAASEFTATYWPWVKVANPSTAVFGANNIVPTIDIPPSGPMMGVYCRNDRVPGGVYKSPANYERAKLSVIGLVNTDVNQESVRDLIHPKRINSIISSTGRGIYAFGGRTRKGTGSFPYIAERRGAILIKRSIKDGIAFVIEENNDATTRRRVTRNVEAFLLTQMRLGAFRSQVPSEAFTVVCDETNNPLDVILRGQLIVNVGIATQKPVEFVFVNIAQDTRGLA
jgi:hypothetical protein